ncbi:hypothetical protein [Streptomyces sp. NBC_01506]|uniref:hypothetical protein n=1 Tax=Streptomyces sp. NBC_01506 TaxID=2903887 RepID=UPI002F90F3D3
MRRVITAALGGALVAATLTLSPAAAYAQAGLYPTYTCNKVESAGGNAYRGSGSCRASEDATVTNGSVGGAFVLADGAGAKTVCAYGTVKIPFEVSCQTF